MFNIFRKKRSMNRDAVFEQLKIDEGEVNEIYLDHLGYPTFGVGHLILESDEEHGRPVGTPVSEERTRACFQTDLDIAIGECELLYEDGVFGKLPDEVQQILVNMMFNMGRTRLSKFKKMHKGILASDWKEAAVEGRDSRWHKQVTNRAERLMERLEKV
jgi:GH24 family phage-related lysozyme (muramidase)|tara:strand:- start:5253 stop:5729 length:477 start_codon:yes stop_codon:yes gene_type:complete